MARNIKQILTCHSWLSTYLAELPLVHLSTVEPLNRTQIRELEKSFVGLFSGNNLNRKYFHAQQSHRTDVPCSHFLASLLIDEATRVVLYWDPLHAVVTTWRTFIKNWKSICDSAIGDLFIVPEDQTWLLFYDHESNYVFGKRRTRKRA